MSKRRCVTFTITVSCPLDLEDWMTGGTDEEKADALAEIEKVKAMSVVDFVAEYGQDDRPVDYLPSVRGAKGFQVDMTRIKDEIKEDK